MVAAEEAYIHDVLTLHSHLQCCLHIQIDWLVMNREINPWDVYDVTISS